MPRNNGPSLSNFNSNLSVCIFEGLPSNIYSLSSVLYALNFLNIVSGEANFSLILLRFSSPFLCRVSLTFLFISLFDAF